MHALSLQRGGVWWRRQIRDPQVMVSLVAAACLLVEAVIAKNVIDVVSGLRDRTSEIVFIAAIILTTAAVLVLYAV